MTCGTSHCAHRSLGFRRWHNIGVIGAVGEQECCSEDECMDFHDVEDGSENIEMREDLIRSTNSLFFTGWSTGNSLQGQTGSTTSSGGTSARAIEDDSFLRHTPAANEHRVGG